MTGQRDFGQLALGQELVESWEAQAPPDASRERVHKSIPFSEKNGKLKVR